MTCRRFILLSVVLSWYTILMHAKRVKPLPVESFSMINKNNVHKKILKNGLTVLVKPVHHTPKVSMQILYHVGSKDEKTGQKGLAHLIEHMIFKGTEKLSESDINFITNKLSGYANAFTSHDTTGYVFDFPSQHWQQGIEIFADCMKNARFDEQMLNSEMKAVIQELKMYKDAHFSDLIEKMLQSIFADHPYHYPIIGFKQDLWSVQRNILFDFYKKHYVPNNAVLSIVGDVDVDEAFALIETCFDSIKKDETYKREEFYHGRDLCSTSVTLARDIQQPFGAFAFVLPGQKEKKHYYAKILITILGQGKTSRLYKKIVDEMHLATDFGIFLYGLEDATLLCMYCEPKTIKDLDTITTIIQKEIDALLTHGIQDAELRRAIKNLKVSYISSLENNAKQAGSLAEEYLMTGDENYMFNALDTPFDVVKKEVIDLVQEYCSSATMHYGKVVPVKDQERKQWITLQNLSDQEDARILDGRVRHSQIEPPVQGLSVASKDAKSFNFSNPEKHVLKNGLKVFIHKTDHVPKASILLDYNTRSHHDPAGKEGLALFVSDLLVEGTKQHPGHQFAQILEDNGISVSSEAGIITMDMLSEDIDLGLDFLQEMLTSVIFDEKIIERVRTQLLANLDSFWDSPKEFSTYLVQQKLYENHPYGKNMYGTKESIKSITKKDIESFYHSYINLKNARLFIVGDINKEKVNKKIHTLFENITKNHCDDLMYPLLKKVSGICSLKHSINRDQVVLVFAGASVERKNPDFDALLLFDQILSGDSMNSRLFMLREQTGLFYTISGSLVVNTKDQPGFWMVKTIVSLDRLEEAKKVILETLKNTLNEITQEELDRARHVLLNDRVSNFSSNGRIAATMLILDKYDLGEDYFDKREQVLKRITLDQVKKAAKKVLDLDNMIILEVGRLK